MTENNNNDKKETKDPLADRTRMVVPRDYASSPNITRFDVNFPPQLEQRHVTTSEWQNTIQRINQFFLEAETLTCGTFIEGCLGCLTLFTFYLFYENKYKKVLQDLEDFIQFENDSVYRKRGLEILNPVMNGLLETNEEEFISLGNDEEEEEEEESHEEDAENQSKHVEEGEEEGEDYDEYYDEGDEEEPDPTLYRFVKRTPDMPFAPRKTDLWVSRQAKFIKLQKRALSLLQDNRVVDPVVLHGLGAAICRTTELARTIIESDLSGKYYLSPTTSTVRLVDEFQPLVDDLPLVTRVRYNSAIHIAIKKQK